MTQRYEILVTPLVRQDVYGSAIDVTKDIDITDLVSRGGIANLIRQVDDGDFDIGVYTFGHINLRCINYAGKFSEPQDYRSIFRYKRDLAKVDINFFDVDGNEGLRFRGLVNDESTRDDFNSKIVTLRVLSLDSVFRKTIVTGGTVATNNLFSTAVFNILNVTPITTILNLDVANINLDVDLQIDDGEFFTNLTVKDALGFLMLASNSILIVDSNDNIFVRNRLENDVDNPQHLFFGSGDPDGRENILRVLEYNTGFHRAFNSINIGSDFGTVNTVYQPIYGGSQKNLDIPFITDLTKKQQIADKVIEEFGFPKTEMILETQSQHARQVELLDSISIDYPKQVTPHPGSKLPFFGQAIAGIAIAPFVSGGFSIKPQFKWKVIAISENPDKMLTAIKVRRAGKGPSDGVFA
ncbi:MAG: hypothetical protein ACUZ8E_17900 [Candidatus Anammoxibacter sp.]